jgi:polyisoprenoid-binding protein YceI
MKKKFQANPAKSINFLIINQLFMKYLNVIAILSTLAILSCNSGPKGEVAETGDAVELDQALTGEAVYTLDQGVIFWAGSGMGKTHTGTLNVTEAELFTDGAELVGGTFSIDMTSVAVTDLDESSGKLRLEGHLRSGDFFLADQYPTGNFEITSITKAENRDDATHMIQGNLTLKNITRSITFPAEIVVDGSAVRAKTPDFTINRTEWGANFGSGIIGTAQDKLISDDVVLSIGLNAKKTEM